MVLLRYLVRTGFRRGVQGNRVWLWTGVGAYGLITIRRIIRTREETVFLGEIKPGAGISVRTAEPMSKQERRARKRAGKPVPRRARREREIITLAE